MEELERGISRISTEKNELKREFDKLSWEQKRIKEVVKHIQICISKREHYEGYRKNPNYKIYMMMNRKDVEAYQKSYERYFSEAIFALETCSVKRSKDKVR